MLCSCNSPLINTLEVCTQFHPGLITEDGTVTNESAAKFLSNYMKELPLFVTRVLTVHPREG